MEKYKNNIRINISYLSFFLLLFQINGVFSVYFDSFESNILSEDDSLIDIKDYSNLFPIITTNKKLYIGVPPSENATITSQIVNISSVVIFNNNYILLACTQDNLLSIINIETGEEKPLITYENYNLPNYTCSISTKDNYVYIGTSNIVIPSYKIKKANDKINNNYENETEETICIKETYNYSFDLNNSFYSSLLTEIITEDEYEIVYDENNKYLENTVFKIKLKEENNEILIDENFNITNYNLKYKNKHIDKMAFPKPFSCEVINIENSEESRLVCGYIFVKDTKINKITYIVNAIVMNSDFNQEENETAIFTFSSIPNIKFQRVDSNTIIYICNEHSFEINLKLEGTKCILDISEENNYYPRFTYSMNLFFISNDFLFTTNGNNLFIKEKSIENYIKVTEDKNIKNIIGYYKEEGDLLIFIYENSINQIKYFTLQNMTYLYLFEGKSKIINVKTNESLTFNVSELITSPNQHALLSFSFLLYYITTTKYNLTYDKYFFDKNTQMLSIEPSINDWVSFIFYIDAEIDGISAGFFFGKTNLTIRTCLFKCGSCYNSYDECDTGTCKLNFTLLENDTEKGCFSNDQHFPNYIYNSTNDLFQKCYHKCKFCSMIGEFSSNISHNCLSCEEGYLRSYIFPGNCFKCEYPLNLPNYSKVVNNSDDEYFEIVESCPGEKKYKINDTGECVDSCPQETVYFDYYLNESLNFSKQEETFIGYFYPLEKEDPPKYLFNNKCYSKCPNLTHESEGKNISECKCNYAWHYNETNDEILCYNNKNYCLSVDYYYHGDDKQCILHGCKEGYYNINFECFKEGCPPNSKLISSELKQCRYNLKYCIINDHYQTKCSNSPYNGYNLRFNESNIYIKLCNESIYYYNVKTYLYKNTCYEYCPEETTKNDTNDRCSCNYYIHYTNKEKSDYECLKYKEKCWDKKRYNITDRKECVDNIEECINLNYSIFNDECLDTCPINTDIKPFEVSDEGIAPKICICIYNYYNKSNMLTCFDNDTNCESEGYPFKMSNTKECFLTKNECIKRGFKVFNKRCYENSCPTDPMHTIEKNNDGICLCNSYFINESDTLICLDEGITCETYGSQSHPYTNIDTKECFSSLNACIEKGLKIFNNNCYNKCPTNTKSKEDSSCICLYYYHTDENNLLNCFDKDKTCLNEDYSYTNVDTKECFNTKEECISKGYKIFNNECYINCPEQTKEKNNENICICSAYTLKEENNFIKCVNSEDECLSHDYYIDKESKECYVSRDICIQNDKKALGRECLSSCPINSQTKDNPNICECSYNYYDENGFLNCFNKDKTCKDEGYEISSDNGECFKSINECFSKNYLFYYDSICYKSNCPPDKIPLNSLEEINKTAIINELQIDNSIIEKLCICNTENNYEGWIISESVPNLQICLDKCPMDYDLDPTTRKCFYFCDPQRDYLFNNICYKHCPEGTFFKDKYTDSRECVCEDMEEIDKDTGFITCAEKIPDQFYQDRKSCPYVYKNKCYNECPPDTCLTTTTTELFKCVDIRPNFKIYNGICIDGIEEYAQAFKYIDDDDNIVPISTPSGVIINAYYADQSLENLIDKYPNITFVDLRECKDKIIEIYNFTSNEKLYIIGIDIPNLSGTSSINFFYFDVYLKNGTQIKDADIICENIKILLSSSINDLDIIKFNKALNFYEEDGYDIYNKTDIFYIDQCAPAQDKGNDITLIDRLKYYYPNVSICNEGCDYNKIDFETQRFICDCNANLSENIYKENEVDGKEYIIEGRKETYSEYFLSLINYKIFKCFHLFLAFKSFYSNAGFYVSFTTLVICLVLFFIFWTKGMKDLRIMLYKNIPTESKTKEKNNQKENKNNLNCILEKNKDAKIQENKPPMYLNITNDHIENSDSNNISNKKVSIICQNDIQNNSFFHNDNDLRAKEDKKIESIKLVKKKEKTNTIGIIKRELKTSKNLLFKGIIHGDSFPKNENILNFSKSINKESKRKNKKKNSDKKVNIDIYNFHNNNNDEKKSELSIKGEKDSKEVIYLTKIKRRSMNKSKAHCISRNLIKLNSNESKKSFDNASLDSLKKNENGEDSELEIDFNFTRLIDRKDDKVEERELNNVSYRQALRIDNRTFIQIFISILENEIDILRLFFYRNPYSHFSLYISIYLFELLLDLTMNCFLYTDDIVSEKYHNNGQLSMITSFSLSFISNIISSIIVYAISKLTNYYEIFEEIIKSVKNRKKYFENIIRLFKYIKVKLGFFYFFEISFIFLITYYLFIFCAIYQKSQGSVMINYIIGGCTSLAISIGLTLIITILRTISIKYHYLMLFNVSKYLYDHF